MTSLRNVAWMALATFVPFSQALAQGEPEVRFISVGSLDWTAENLSVRVFRNGDPIPEVGGATAWAEAGGAGLPATSTYENRLTVPDAWGRLYNYAALVDPRGLCPAGWRIPDDADWRDLEAALGSDRAGLRLRARSGWPSGGEGSDDVSFGGLPAGFRTQRGEYFLGGRVAYFWSSTPASPTETTAHMLFDYSPKIFRIKYSKAMGMSVRCVRKRAP